MHVAPSELRVSSLPLEVGLEPGCICQSPFECISPFFPPKALWLLVCFFFSFFCRQVTCRLTYVGILVKNRISAKSVERGQCWACPSPLGHTSRSGLWSAVLSGWLYTSRLELALPRRSTGHVNPPRSLALDTCE